MLCKNQNTEGQQHSRSTCAFLAASSNMGLKLGSLQLTPIRMQRSTSSTGHSKRPMYIYFITARNASGVTCMHARAQGVVKLNGHDFFSFYLIYQSNNDTLLHLVNNPSKCDHSKKITYSLASFTYGKVLLGVLAHQRVISLSSFERLDDGANVKAMCFTTMDATGASLRQAKSNGTCY